jgi:hypothetical protein
MIIGNHNSLTASYTEHFRLTGGRQEGQGRLLQSRRAILLKELRAVRLVHHRRSPPVQA